MPKADWSAAEWWVWKEVSAGRIAKFHERLHIKRDPLDPRSCKGWCDDRLLSSAFLREIFYDGSLGKEIPPNGVQIEGALFRDKLDLRYGRLHGHLSLEACRFEQGIDLAALTIEGYLSLWGSFISSGNGATAVDLTATDIEGQLNFDGAEVEGLLKMGGLHVGLGLFMRNADKQPARFEAVDLTRFEAVDLTGAHIEGQLNLIGATVTGKLMMNSLQVDHSMFIQSSPDGPPCDIHGNVDLAFARIKGGLQLQRASFKGKLTLDQAEIGASLSVSDVCGPDGDYIEWINMVFGLSVSDFCGAKGNGLTASLRLTKVAGNADFASSVVADLDLSGATIGGELGVANVVWKKEERLNLCSAHASALQEGSWSWPKHIELNGFTYDRIGGVDEPDSERLERRKFHQKYIVNWLGQDSTYTPQPYEQLAKVLQMAGEPQRASDVIYASREQARKKALFWPYLGMSLLSLVIGYGVGYRYFRCLWWILGFTALGTVILYFGAQHITTPEDYVVYSLDKLLPFAKLDEFKGVTLSRLATGYYYVHQLIGYVLAGFLAAGLAGLTQKS